MNRRNFISGALGVCMFAMARTKSLAQIQVGTFAPTEASHGTRTTWSSQFPGTTVSYPENWKPTERAKFAPVAGQVDYLLLDTEGSGAGQNGRVIFTVLPAQPGPDVAAYVAGLPDDLPVTAWGYAPGTAILDRGATGTTGWIITGYDNGTPFPGVPALAVLQFPTTGFPSYVETLFSLPSADSLEAAFADLQLNGESIVRHLDANDLITRMKFKS